MYLPVPSKVDVPRPSSSVKKKIDERGEFRVCVAGPSNRLSSDLPMMTRLLRVAPRRAAAVSANYLQIDY